MKIDYVVISSDDNPLYKDFYPIVAKKWYDLGFKTFYINITDCDERFENEYGIVQKIKKLDFVSSGFQSQVVRLFSSNLIEGNLLMSDIDMLPLNGDYYRQYEKELTDDNVIIYSGQPYGNVPYYPICYVLSHSSNFRKYLNIENMSFNEYCLMLSRKYGQKWNTDENFMYDEFQNFIDKLNLKSDRDFSRRICRSNWTYNIELLNKGHYIDSHLLRPYIIYKKQVDELISRCCHNSFNLDVVIGHYNENLSWINNIKINCNKYIYSKSNKNYEDFVRENNISTDLSKIKVINQKINIGNEVTSYLNFIVDNYHNLSDYVYFCHGHNESYHQDYSNDFLVNNVDFTKSDYINTNNYYNIIDEFKTVTLLKFEKVGDNKPYIILKYFFETFFSKFYSIEDKYNSFSCAQFFVSKNCILSNSLDFYKECLDWFNSEKSLEVDRKFSAPNNVYSGRVFEWLWCYIFTKNKNEKIYSLKDFFREIK